MLAARHHDVFELVDRDWLKGATEREVSTMDRLTRLGLERTLDLAVWLDVYHPDLKLS